MCPCPVQFDYYICHRAGLAGALGDPIEGLYTDNASAPLQAHAGLRNLYRFGLYSYCAYVNTSHGTCSNHSTANRWEPFNVITADMALNYSIVTDELIPSDAFTDSQYIGDFTNGAWYLLLIGTMCTALAFFMCVCVLCLHRDGFPITHLIVVSVVFSSTRWHSFSPHWLLLSVALRC